MENKGEKNMLWLKRHVDSIAVITVVVGATWTLSGFIYGIEKRTDEKISALEKDITIIKTIVSMGYNSQRQLVKQVEEVNNGN